MKLAPSQIETIELYLLSHELRDRDFYNEILDHFIVTLENKLDQGEEFDYAFPELTYEFADFSYKANWMSPEYFGLKGRENEFLTNKVRSSKNNVLGQVLKSLNLFNAKIACCILIPCFLAYYDNPGNWELKHIMAPQIILFVCVAGYLLYKGRTKVLLLFKSSLSLSVENLKVKQLDTFGSVYFLFNATMIVFSIFSVCKVLLEDFIGIDYIAVPYVVITTFLYISIFTQVFKLESKSN